MLKLYTNYDFHGLFLNYSQKENNKDNYNNNLQVQNKTVLWDIQTYTIEAKDKASQYLYYCYFRIFV